jgi:hypothetical protein
MRPAGNETGAIMSSAAIKLNIGNADALAPAFNQSPTAAARKTSPDLLSAQLLAYWRCQLTRPVALRRRALDAVLDDIRSGAATAASLVPFALGDTDEEIVFRATVAQFDPVHAGSERRHSAIEDAVEWIRRRLALNRTAVFAALLSLGDERVLECLLPLRLTLDDAEFDAVCRRLWRDPPPPTREFLRVWIELRGATAQRASAATECLPATPDHWLVGPR